MLRRKTSRETSFGSSAFLWIEESEGHAKHTNGEFSAFLTHILIRNAVCKTFPRQGPPTPPPVVTGGLGRRFWPKKTLRIPLGFPMEIEPEFKNEWPITVISV